MERRVDRRAVLKAAVVGASVGLAVAAGLNGGLFEHKPKEFNYPLVDLEDSSTEAGFIKNFDSILESFKARAPLINISDPELGKVDVVNFMIGYRPNKFDFVGYSLSLGVSNDGQQIRRLELATYPISSGRPEDDYSVTINFKGNKVDGNGVMTKRVKDKTEFSVDSEILKTVGDQLVADFDEYAQNPDAAKQVYHEYVSSKKS